MYKWGESALRISRGVPGQGMMAISPHQANSAVVYLAGGLAEPLNHSIQVPSMSLSKGFNLLGPPTSHEWRHGHWERETDVFTLGWCPEFSFGIGPHNYIAGTVYNIVW